jgi:HAAS domain-containing protein
VTAGQVIETYLAQVAAALPGPARARRDLVAELRSGLLEAADAHRRAGLPAAAAAAAAVREFGDPRQVAAAFRPELTARHARRLAVALAVTGVPVGLLWLHAVQASHPAISRAPLWRWIGQPPVPLAAAAFLIAALVALCTIALTGRLIRWLPGGPRTAALSAAVGGYGAAAADAAIFVLLVHQLATAPATLAPIPVSAAASASLARLVFSGRAARRCMTAQAALTGPD